MDNGACLLTARRPGGARENEKGEDENTKKTPQLRELENIELASGWQERYEDILI